MAPPGRVRIYAADLYLERAHAMAAEPALQYHYFQDPGGHVSDYAAIVRPSTAGEGAAGGGGHREGRDGATGYHHPSVAGSSRQPQQQLPENAMYYTGVNYGPYPHYAHDPYGSAAYVDGTYRTAGPMFTSSVYPSTVYGQAYGAYAYPPPPPTAGGGSYQAYPQPSPPYRRDRARTAPPRTMQRNSAIYAAAGTQQRRPRGVSMDFDQRGAPYRTYLAPGKKPPHMYRRSRIESHYAVPPGIGPITDYPYPTMTMNTRTQPRQRPSPSIYQPSYTTYPPTKMQFRERQAKSYPLWLRAALKATQLILGAAILGLILGPMRNTSFIDFVQRTRTEWQGLVIGIEAALAIITAILLTTVYCGHKNDGWRKIDAHLSVVAILLGLLAACIEAYFAACYPPNGPRLNLVCHRAEWIIATILCFINVVLYIIDFTLAFRAGVSML